MPVYPGAPECVPEPFISRKRQARATQDRRRSDAPVALRTGTAVAAPSNKLTDEEELQVLAVLNSPRFVDKPPKQIYATLLAEGNYLCSISTMYRILGKHAQVKDRRRQATHPPRSVPELQATGPRQVYSLGTSGNDTASRSVTKVPLWPHLRDSTSEPRQLLHHQVSTSTSPSTATDSPGGRRA